MEVHLDKGGPCEGSLITDVSRYLMCMMNILYASGLIVLHELIHSWYPHSN